MRLMKINIFIMLILIVIGMMCIPCLANETTYVWSNNSNSINEQNLTNSTQVNSDLGNNRLSLESGSAILIEQSTGQILYSHNMHEKLRPASVTKVMSILLIMEQIDNRKAIFK